MLERQNAKRLVSLINISDETFFFSYISRNSNLKRKVAKTKQFDLEAWLWVNRALPDPSVMNWGSYQINNSQYTARHLYCHNLEPLANQQQLRTMPWFFFFFFVIWLFSINSFVATSVKIVRDIEDALYNFLNIMMFKLFSQEKTLMVERKVGIFLMS